MEKHYIKFIFIILISQLSYISNLESFELKAILAEKQTILDT